MADRHVWVAFPSAPHRPWAARARDILADPSIVAAILPATAVVALLLMLTAHHWSASQLASLVGGTTMAAVFAVVNAWFAWRRKLPLWSLHVEIATGNMMVSAVVAVTATQHIDMANLYLLTATVSALMFSVRAAVAHTAAAGVYYAAVLAFAPVTVASPLIAWLAVFGTAAAVGTVVIGLVSVLRFAATADPLTGLANRRAWDERLDQETERSRRTGTALSVVLIDLDGFKDINDRDGHAAGDRLLQATARAWQTQVRGGGDFLARIGGDEFAVLTTDADQMGIHQLIRRFDEAAPPGMSFSAGEATWDRTERAPELLHRADLAMYETKLRNRRRRYPHTA